MSVPLSYFECKIANFQQRQQLDNAIISLYRARFEPFDADHESHFSGLPIYIYIYIYIYNSVFE